MWSHRFSGSGILYWVPWFRVSHKLQARYWPGLLYLRAGWIRSTSKLTHTVDSHQDPVGCWPNTSVPCYVSFSTGPLTIWELAFLGVRQRVRASKMQISPSVSQPQVSQPITSAMFLCYKGVTEASHIRGGDYTRPWIPGGEDHWEPFWRLDPNIMEMLALSGLLLLQPTWGLCDHIYTE